MPRKQKARKSHHGCFECKRRSVKCNEKRPQCSHCENRQAICHYAASGPWLWAETGAGHAMATAMPEATISSESATASHYAKQPGGQHASHGTATPMNEFNIPHLRLLLSWTTSTCHSISRNHADAGVWERIIPKRALSCPYILHGIFTVSALHLALSDECDGIEQQALIEDAGHHQSGAIKMFTNPSDVAGPSEHLESFALSSLLIISAFAFPLVISRRSQAKSNPLDELVGVFMLIRKMINFSTPIMDGVKKSELSGLFLLEDVESSPSESSQRAIASLHELLSTVCSPSHENYEVFTRTIDRLEKLFSQLDSKYETISGSFNWVCDVPAAYIDLLQEHDPLALVILAHYCVVLHQLRKRWWISSWGRLVLDAVVETLSPTWSSSVAYAIHAIDTPVY
ncbi:hypothetical protein BDV25DRAFT_159198 [Aspergillus avenaceus]|uniref:Zn(2)-C6 fungal-type domain-containing protein n=1 Tax=Aspergillus avenaceus TaxID=36643 RepID=A0A5N6TNX2_ASPAV|nr:hypothetical protein BDV25DRAFT_159198 [Aspergillus avenaceus]